MTSKNLINCESGSAFKERRSFIAAMATLAGSVILPATALTQPTPEADKKTKSPASVCGHSTVIASDAATIAETTAGKIRGFRRNSIYIFKGVPYGASTAGARRFMPPIKPEPWTGIRNALQYGRICPYLDSAHFDTNGKNLANSDEDQFVLHRGAAATARRRLPARECMDAGDQWVAQAPSHGLHARRRIYRRQRARSSCLRWRKSSPQSRCSGRESQSSAQRIWLYKP
jgi:hypothetical protein